MAALDGMRVLDVTQYESGTSCTQQLAWMGADVVKVEPPSGDPGRLIAPDEQGHSQYFFNFNSNKRSVSIDLSSADGRRLLLDMAPHYHVFVENYGPGVIERFDLGYEVFRAVNPGIIYARIKGFGTWGPYSDYNVYDWVAQAAGGTFSVTGERDGPPVMIQPTFADSGTGLQAALAIVGAYVKQLRTGEGEQIDLSMQEAVTFFMKTVGIATWGQRAPRRLGNRRGAPSGIYPCRGDGPNDYVFIFMNTSDQWDTLCSKIGHPEFTTDPRFADPGERQRNQEELYRVVGDWMASRTKYEVMHELAEAGVPCSAILDPVELHTDPHLVERGLVHSVEHPTAGEVRLFRNPPLTHGSQVPLGPAPLLGQHTDEVLISDLSLDRTALAGLRQDRTIV